MNAFHTIAAKFFAGIATIAMLFTGGQVLQQPSSEPLFGTTQLIAGSTYTLSGAGVSSSATSITITSFTIPQTGQKILDADLSDTFYITLEPGNKLKQELVSCTTSTQNANDTATFSGCTRGLSPIPPYTASTSLRLPHGGGTQVIFSNPPQVFNEYAAKQNTETITGQWTFDDNDSFRPRIDADTDTAVNTAFVTLGQLSRQAISGASNASLTIKGIVELATGSEAGSSTPTGGTAANLALSTLISTSSPYTTGSWSVMTMPNGKIRQNFLDLTESFTWSGIHSFLTGVTFGGTTTIPASGLLSNPLILNGLSYKFPTAHTASSSVLSSDGAGNLSWNQPSVYTLFASNTEAVLSGTTATTSMVTVTIPANTINTRSMLEFIASTQRNVNAGHAEVLFGNGSATTSLVSCSQGFCNLSGKLFATSTTAGNFYATSYSVDTDGVINRISYLPYNFASTLYLSFSGRPSASGSGDFRYEGINVVVKQQ